MTQLEVQLTASIKDLESKLKQAEKLQQKYGATVERESNKAAKGFAKTGKGAANALPATQEFSRVIQDLPFGIQGVGNNLQQLTANFGNLSTRVGGSKAAISAMISSLSGPAGMLLAVSAVTSLLTVYSDEIAEAFGSTNELAKATAEFTASAQSEITTLRNLVDISRNENLSKKVRLGAIERLNDKYSQYLGNLDLESVRTDSVKASVDALTTSLLKQAQVRGVQALIEEKFKDSSEDLVGLQLRQKDAARAVVSEIDNLRSSVAAFNNVSKDLPFTEQIRQIQEIVNNSGGSGGGRLRLLSSLVSQFNESVKATENFKGELESELKPIQELLNSLTIDDLFNEFSSADNGITVYGERLKSDANKVKNEFKNLDDIFGINTSAQNTLDKFKPDFSNFQTQFNKLGDIVEFSIKDSVSKVRPELSKIEAALNDFNTSASDIINNGIANTFSGIGRAIGQSLAEGGNVFGSIAKTLLNTAGQIAVQLGEVAIGIGVSMLAIKASFSNPFTAIAAGVALVALGSALSGLANSAVSGTGSGTSSVSGQGGGGSSSFSGGSFSSGVGGGRVVFEISGQKLIGVLNNTLDGNTRLGGNISIG